MDPDRAPLGRDAARAALVVVAAGVGRRLLAGRHKALVPLAGTPLVEHCLRRLLALRWLDPVVLVGHASDRAALEQVLARLPRAVRLVEGGARRQDSVLAGLAALEALPAATCPDVVLVHDAARPFVPSSQLAQLVDLVRPGAAAILALPVADTIKEAAPGQPPRALRTLPRHSLWAAQTPQAAYRRELLALLSDAAREGRDVTDEAALFETAGFPVAFVEGSRLNFKVTSAEDLRLAEAVLALEAERTP